MTASCTRGARTKCGFTWIPSKMATGLPVCQECLDIYENDPNDFGDRGELPDE